MFNGVNMTGADLRAAMATNAQLEGAVMRNVDVGGAVFENAFLARSDWTGARGLIPDALVQARGLASVTGLSATILTGIAAVAAG